MEDTNNKQDICIMKMAEQIKHIEEKLSQMPTKDEMALVVQEGITRALEICEKKYVTQERIKPLEKIVYGLLGVVLTAIAIAVIGLVIVK